MPYLGERSIRHTPPAIEKGGEPTLSAYVIHAGYGAGKSTLMRILSGLMPAKEGHLRMAEKQINALPVLARVRAGLVLIPEGRQVFPELSVRDNLRLGAYSCKVGMAERMAQIIGRFPPLAPLLDRRAGLLSGGEQQMLAVGRALMAQPRILPLDEPSLGLSPQATSDLFDQRASIRDDDVAMLVVDQMADLALVLSSRAYLLGQGRIHGKGVGGVHVR